MILLFNNIYLEVDNLIQSSTTRIVISKVYGDLMYTERRFGTLQSDTTKCLYQSTTLDNLLDQHFNKDPNALMKYLVAYPANERLVVYCDAETMLHVLLKYWKTVLPRLDDDGVYTLINCTGSQISESLGIGYSSNAVLDPTNAAAVRRDYSPWTNDDSKPAMLSQWHTTTPFVISRTERETIIRTLPLELQLASALVNPAWPHRRDLERRVVRLTYKMAIQDFIDDVRAAVLEGLVCFHYFEPDTKFNFFEHSLDDLVAMHPSYKFLTDPLFTPSNVDYVVSAYDLDELKQIHTRTFDDTSAYFIDQSPILRNGLTFDDIIEYELANKFTLLLGKRGFLRNRVNQYLVDLILAGVRSKDLSLLNSLYLG